MKFSTITRAGAAALVLALTPALASAAVPSEHQPTATHDCTRRDCPCGKADAGQTESATAKQVREREANDALLKQVWTAP